MVPGVRRWAILTAVLLVGCPRSNAAPATAETPNIDTPVVIPRLTGDFLFTHRFSVVASKVLSSPTFDLQIGVFPWASVGLRYATSTDVDSRINEFEPILRFTALNEQKGALLDLGAAVAYNTASRSADFAVLAARTLGRVSFLGALKAFTNGFGAGGFTAAGSIGLQVHLTKFLLLAGDLGHVFGAHDFEAIRATSDRLAWSAGFAFDIPYSPHSVSFYATNANTHTLEGTSRGSPNTRYGFAFDIPFTSVARWIAIFNPPAETEAAQKSPEKGKATEVTIRNSAFAPTEITVHAGDTVRWTNNDNIPHTVTSDTKLFDSGLINPGTSWSHTFDQAGSFPYFCTVHPFMKAKVTVQ